MAYDRSNRSKKPIAFRFKGRYVDAKWGGYPAHYGWKIRGNELHMHAATGRKVYKNIMLKWRWSPRHRVWIGISGNNRSYILTKRQPRWYKPPRETRPDPLYRRQVPEKDTYNRYNVPVPSGTWKAYDRSNRSRKPLPFHFKGRYVDVKWKGYPAHYGWKIRGNELHMHAATGRKVYKNIMQKWRWSPRLRAYVGISGNNKNLILTRDRPDWYRPPRKRDRKSNPLFHRQKPGGSSHYNYNDPMSPSGVWKAYNRSNPRSRPLDFRFRGRYVDVKWKGYPAHYGWKVQGNTLLMYAATGKKVYNRVMQKWQWSPRMRGYVGVSGDNRHLVLRPD
jgi:hypothetical protein